MPLLGFKREFAEAVRSGAKRQTIRARRKRPFRIGDVLYLYTGLRTKKCRKLGEAECILVAPVTITRGGLIIGGRICTSMNQEFQAHMEAWFEKTQGLPFQGDLIVWRKKSSTKRRKK